MGTNFFCASGGSAAIFLRKGWYKIESRERVKKTKQREVDAVYVNGVKMIIIVDLYLYGVRTYDIKRRNTYIPDKIYIMFKLWKF